MTKDKIAIPLQYDIYRQDLSRNDLYIEKVGYVKNIEEARTMCKVFNESDKAVLAGKAVYIFVCAKLLNEGEVTDEQPLL